MHEGAQGIQFRALRPTLRAPAAFRRLHNALTGRWGLIHSSQPCSACCNAPARPILACLLRPQNKCRERARAHTHTHKHTQHTPAARACRVCSQSLRPARPMGKTAPQPLPWLPLGSAASCRSTTKRARWGAALPVQRRAFGQNACARACVCVSLCMCVCAHEHMGTWRARGTRAHQHVCGCA